MKILEIDGRNYTLEYTIEASLYNACTEKVTSFMASVTSEKGGSEKLKEIVSTMASIPNTALTLFYAGLLENHSDEIRSERDAKELVKKYFAEHRDDESGNFYGLLNILIECMGDDGFFKQIGLTQITQDMSQTKQPKTPQDHKKKTKTVTKATEK